MHPSSCTANRLSAKIDPPMDV